MNQKKDIMSVLSDLDINTVEMADIANLLQLFDESLWDEVSYINPKEPWTAVHFKDRFKVVCSILTVARERLYEVIKGMEASVADGRDILRQNREGNA